jgi:hypothetical protein
MVSHHELRPGSESMKQMVDAQGWSKAHARDLGEMADTVYYTLKEIGRI